MILCEKCIVRGRVQGVFYRDSTRQQAEKHGVTGYAKNRTDGSVEVLLCGRAESVGHVKAWLWEGPRMAHVSEVKCELVEMKPPVVFVTG